NIQHSAVFEYIRKDNPAARAVSAGFFYEEPGAFWHGGESETLGLPSRPQDAQHIQSMLKSADRRLWDLRVLVWEACEASRRQAFVNRAPTISMA
ncbi:MAG: hypothetical protein WCH99_13960, partial [Verrucomicrobiota bacterium]